MKPVGMYCDQLVRERLLPEALALANDIVAEIKQHAATQTPGDTDDGAGLIVQVMDHDALHNGLALVSAPVPPGPDAQASAVAFCDWLVQTALETPLVGQAIHVVKASRGHAARAARVVGFTWLSLEGANAVVYRQWQRPKWVHELRRSKIGQFALVLCVASGDCFTMYEPVHVFD